MKKNHMLWMIIACGLPLLLIFFLPSFGVSSDITLFLFLAVFFIAHLFMMGGHSHHGKQDHEEKQHHH